MTVTLIPQQTPQYEFTYKTSTVDVTAVIAGTKYNIQKGTVELNAHGASDSADVTLPLAVSPDFTVMFKDTAWIPLQLYARVSQAQPPSSSTSDIPISPRQQLFSGSIDVNSMAFHDDAISFKCRSLASLLVDNRITAIPRNMTTVQFVESTAKQYGLTPHINLPKGQYKLTVAELYAHDFAVGVQNDRIWDVYMKMAQVDDADVWVSGNDLYYASPSLIPRTTVDLKYGRDIETLTAEHSAASKAIRVEVRIYNQRTRVSQIQRIELSNDLTVRTTSSSRYVTSTPEFGTKNTSTTSISSSGTVSTTQNTVTGGPQQTFAGRGPDNANGALIYKYYRPGWSLDAANAFAQTTLRRLQMQAYTVSIRIPITQSRFEALSLITSLIRLHGVPMQMVNDTYYPRKITWNIDPDNPSIDLECVNIQLPSGQV